MCVCVCLIRRCRCGLDSFTPSALPSADAARRCSGGPAAILERRKKGARATLQATRRPAPRAAPKAAPRAARASDAPSGAPERRTHSGAPSGAARERRHGCGPAALQRCPQQPMTIGARHKILGRALLLARGAPPRGGSARTAAPVRGAGGGVGERPLGPLSGELPSGSQHGAAVQKGPQEKRGGARADTCAADAAAPPPGNLWSMPCPESCVSGLRLRRAPPRPC